MKKISRAGLFLLAFLAIAIVLFTPSEKEKYAKQLNEHPFAQAENKTPEELKKLPKRDRPDLAWQQDFLLTMDPSTGMPAPERLLPVYQQVAAFNAQQSQLKTPGATSSPWVERGPTNVGGRTRAIMYDPNDPTHKKVWAGGVTGGLWYNNDITDVNSQWVAVDDFWANITISAIAFDPNNSNTFYVGTGEGWGAGSGRGAGIWKSTDGGTTWAQLSASSGFYWVNDLVVRNEAGSSVIYAAVRGNYYAGQWHGSSTDGLHRSTNGGASFTQVLPTVPGESINYAPADIEISANNRIWIGTLESSYSATDRGGGRILYSDNGTSWTTAYTSTGGHRVELACAPSNANYVYAIVESNSVVSEMVKSTNAGTSWSNMTEPNDADNGIPSTDFSRGQAWYDLIIQVHPTNANMVYAGGIDLFRSSNGGSSRDQVSHWYGGFGYPNVHADQHQMIFNPGNANELLFGNDGGLYRSTNAAAGTMSFSSLNRNYNVTQFYSCAIHPTAGSNYALAGTQDNGTQKFTLPGLDATTEPTGGDGAYCFIDQTNPNYQVTSYVYNSYWRSLDGGINFGSRIQSDQSTGRFINPTDYDDNLDALYSARTTTTINRILNLSGSYFIDDFTVSGMSSMASHLRVSPYTTSSTTLFVGTESGDLFKITNANTGSPSASSIGAALPAGSISCVEIGASENELLVTFTNYGVVSVWYTSNGGSTWQNKEGNLPDMPVRWALFNPNNRSEVILATEVGVWATDNIGVSTPNWVPSNSGLANVRVNMLQYRDSDKEVLAATYGRGLFTSSGFVQQVAPTANFGASTTGACTGETIILQDSSTGGVGSRVWSISPNTFSFVSGTNANSANPEVQFSANGKYTVSLTVSNSIGSDSIQKFEYINIGGVILPISVDFESGLAGWTIENPDGTTTWQEDLTASGSTGGSTTLSLDNYNYQANGQEDYLISPAIDLSNFTSASLSFEYAYRRYDVGYQDSLAIDVSTDCGLTWTRVVVYKEDGTGSWNTGTDLTSYFTPSSASDWCGGSNPVCPTVDLSAFLGSNGVKVRFANINGYGNVIYLDNILVSGQLSAQPSANFTVSQPVVCEQGTTKLNDLSSNNPDTWSWTITPSAGVSFINGTNANSQHPELQFSTAGMYSVELNTANVHGADTLIKSNVIEVLAPASPSLQIAADTNGVCEGSSIQFSSFASHGGSSPSFNWFVNGVSTGTSSASFSSNTLQDGDTVSAEMLSSDTCVTSNLAQSNIVVMSFTTKDTASVLISRTSFDSCAFSTVDFSSTGTHLGTSPTYSWMVNGNPVGGNTSSISLNNLVDGDLVSLSVSSSENCLVANTVISNNILVNFHALPNVSLSSASGKLNFCKGDTITFLSSPQGGNLIGAGLTGNEVYTSGLADGQYQYFYDYTDANGCVNSDSLTVVVSDVPVPTISYASQTLTCNENGFSYQWFDTGGAINGATLQTYSPSLNGDYYVEISKNGCTKQSAIYSVQGIHVEHWPGVKSISVYPNPVRSWVSVQLFALQAEQVLVSLTDMNGRVFIERTEFIQVGDQVIRIDVSELPSGLYILRSSGESGYHYQSIEVIR